MYSIINKSNFGNCSQCGTTNTDCVKKGKVKICLFCNNSNKAKKQIENANEKQKFRSLIKYERQEGILDSIKELKLDLDRVTSRYIRLRDMEADGKITCYCCEKRIAWQKAHCMHFINREHMATRYLIANLKSGCFECNVEKRGNLIVYAAKLESEQSGIVEWLTDQSRTTTNVSQSELKSLLFEMQSKLNMVETKLNKVWQPK